MMDDLEVGCSEPTEMDSIHAKMRVFVDRQKVGMKPMKTMAMSGSLVVA